MKKLIALDGDTNVTGTGYFGRFPRPTFYRDLVRVFGEPNGVPDPSTQVEWRGSVLVEGQFIPFTIYDYKAGVAPEENFDWHVGSRGEHGEFVAGIVVGWFMARCWK